jgi:glutamate formiminotransferase / formiminotetrahydrofolate cyclodeaminase
MGKFVECVPNFSEGRDLAKINAIVDAARAVPGVIILDVEKDADHNRTVLTFIAPLETAPDAMFAVTKKASQLIDLNHHKGEHPRMGATDVAPFIPILDTTIEECVLLAEVAGARIGRELQIPVYLYDRAAKFEHRKDLAKVRKGQFEGLREVIGKDAERVPDFGPNHIHPTAGAMAVGARNQIVNFNVNLATTDMEFDKELAKSIRTSGGGLPALRAKEIFLESKGQVQMSTVLTDYKTTSVKRVMDELQKHLGPKNIAVTGTELIGLTSVEALTDYAIENLAVKDFNKEAQVLETKLLKLMGGWQAGANAFVDALANTDPTPGGGSAGAVSAAMGCALGMMAVGISLRSKKLDESKRPALETLRASLAAHKAELQACVSEDSASFDRFMEAMKLPKDNPERKDRMQAALKYAAEVPLKTARLAAEALAGLRVCSACVSAQVTSDYRSALYQLEAGIRCAAENVLINAEGLEDKAAAEKLAAEVKDHLAACAPVQA